MPELDEKQVEQILNERALSRLLPVHHLARRPGCTVWRGRLLTAHGDANAQIQFYAFRDEPESIVDFEEEITALTDDAGLGRALVRELRDEEWGILVTCASKDAQIFESFFAGPEPEEPSITYHPQLDRILGGDYFHQIKEHWAKACLSSIARAMQLKELLSEAEKAYEAGPSWSGKLKRPLPVLLAVLQISAIPLEGAPASYNELALMQFVIESPKVIQIAPTSGEAELTDFARQLCAMLGIAHRCGICFSRDAGSCLRPEFLLRSGALTDAYFISHPDAGEPLKKLRERDLWNALIVTCEMAGDDVELTTAALRKAAVSYTGKARLSKDVERLIESAASGFLSQSLESLEALVHVLTA